jgi:hypothetical protein
LFKPPSLPNGVNCSSGSSYFIFSDELDATNGWTGFGNGTWTPSNGTTSSSSTGPSGAFSGNGYFYFEASSPNYPNVTSSVISPAINLSAANSTAELSMFYHAYGANIGNLEIGISTSAAGPFTTIGGISQQIQNSETDPWLPIGIDISSYIGQTIYIELKYTSGSSFAGDMSIDLIQVETCN